MNGAADIESELKQQFGADHFRFQTTCDAVPTLWVSRGEIKGVLRYLKTQARPRYEMLYDLTAIDERVRQRRDGQPESDITVVYHLLSFEGDTDLRLKVALRDGALDMPTLTGIWPAANWYEREVWDMFGVNFQGHPHLRRILMPPTWETDRDDNRHR